MWAQAFDPLALSPLLPGSPDIVFVFGETTALRAPGLLARLRARFPAAIQLGCSTGSAVSGPNLEEAGVNALAVGFQGTRVALHTQPLPDAASSRAVGQALARDIAAPDLAGVFLLSVGLGVNGSGLVEGLQETLGRETPISGGLAGDGARFAETLVAVNGQAVDGVVAALTLHGDAIRIAHGCFGGWTEFGPKRRVTACDGAVLHELDGKPALDLYESYLGEEAAGLPASGLLYPLKIWDPANPEDQVARTLLAIDRENRSLILAGDVPLGWRAQLMRGTIDDLVNGARRAAEQASQAMRALGAEPRLCLFGRCVGRRLLMGQRTEEEIEAVAEVLGGAVPISGYYSYGEIASRGVRAVAGLHNQTVTLTLWSEAA